MAKCPKYYTCDMSTNGDLISQSCEDIGYDKSLDKKKAKCLELRIKWEKFRASQPDWEEEKEDDETRKKVLEVMRSRMTK